ncbi:ABC transporter substrate-binding protein, partial [Thioclava sp. BHET1]
MQVKHKFIAAAALSALVLSSASGVLAKTPKDTLVQAWAIDDMISLDPAEVFEFSA